jgi:hypothetical protein
MVEAKRAADRSGKRNAETVSGPTAAIVALFLSQPLELDRTKPLRTDNTFFLGDGRKRRQVRAAL